MKYNFILKDNNQKAYSLFTWFLFFLHIAAAIFALNTDNNKVRLSVGILLVFYVLLSSAYYFYRRHPRALETFSLVMALLYANFWFQQAGIIAALAFAVIFIAVTVVKGKRTSVLVSAEGVDLTRVFKTVTFSWEAMDNVMLKDNLITIDLKNNTIIQAEIVENNRMIDEDEFNQFCQSQMSR